MGDGGTELPPHFPRKPGGNEKSGTESGTVADKSGTPPSPESFGAQAPESDPLAGALAGLADALRGLPAQEAQDIIRHAQALVGLSAVKLAAILAMTRSQRGSR